MSDPEVPEGSDARRSVLGRAFLVLDCFAGGVEMSVSRIGQRTGLPPATVHRILASLVEWGGVEHVSHGRYRLGSRIWRLGVGAPQVRVLRELAQPYLVDLHIHTAGTVYLAVRDGSDTVFSDRITRVRRSTDTRWVARRAPLSQSGAGRVLLAYSDEAWELQKALAQTSDEAAAELEWLEQERTRIRDRGIAISSNDGVKGRYSVACPVFGFDGMVVASIAVAFPDTRIPDPTTVAPWAKATARSISNDLVELGY
ncbi:IclR family transcriptional regulator [uncultured Microbacterium sp.]|uniref:IclR family transcriptional regulator n=1 Tax=uncultured Microbacterium sp. TaxID=191216 RepID=UPI0026385CD3|nr:IclR family transcriptional regulator [uncultured Microbacterium sp.]